MPLTANRGTESLTFLFQCRFTSRESIRRVQRELRRPRAGEDAEERVVVPLADGIKLVIVAAGAAHRHAQRGLRDDIDLVVRELHQLIQRIDREEAMLHHAQAAQTGTTLHNARLRIDARLQQQITRDVLPHELVIRHIRIQSADEIVAILKRPRHLEVTLTAVALRVAKPVHPVPRPSLAEMR